MFAVQELSKICLILLFSLPQITPNSYNLETESLRIYGESYGSLLKQFRRTPEYLDILKEKYAELQLLFFEIFMHAAQYVTENNMKKMVASSCGFEETTTPHAIRMIPVRRNEGDENNNEVATKTPIDLLDNYPRFQSFLTTQERNKYRDIGFEMSGKLFHMVMEAMGPVDAAAKSSKRPYDDEDSGTTTTEKDHRHQVTQLGPDRPEEPHEHEHVTHDHEGHEVTHESKRYKFINF